MLSQYTYNAFVSFTHTYTYSVHGYMLALIKLKIFVPLLIPGSSHFIKCEGGKGELDNMLCAIHVIWDLRLTSSWTNAPHSKNWQKGYYICWEREMCISKAFLCRLNLPCVRKKCICGCGYVVLHVWLCMCSQIPLCVIQRLCSMSSFFIETQTFNILFPSSMSEVKGVS